MSARENSMLRLASRPLFAPDSGSDTQTRGAADPSLPADALVILPMREAVLFPGTVLPLAVGRQSSVAAVQYAMRAGQQIGVVMQRDPQVAEPTAVDLHRMGTIANILRWVTAPDGSHHLIAQGVQRFRVV